MRTKIRGEIVKFTNKSVTVIDTFDRERRKFRTSNALMNLHVGEKVELYRNSKGIVTSGIKIDS